MVTSTAHVCVSDMGNHAAGAPMEVARCNHGPTQSFDGITLANSNGGGW